MSETCAISEDIKTQFKKFKMGKSSSSAAFLMKIDKDKLIVEIDEVIDNVGSLSDFAEELPEFAPRFIALSYKYTHKDGRTSFPLVFIFYCPQGINPALNMMYASTKQRLQTELQIMKVFDLRKAEELNEEWLNQKLGFFG
eukprot:TRINITY_DN3615_c0_g1_i1.p1 TRINITY_DN3615_c0_g1~~TRINITY_DN3615_c0_g1_i1.p1  ORF type:complete len:156 (-),score=48.74 TRINITY_DN3615_c0_g1_i1:80-502(-)